MDGRVCQRKVPIDAVGCSSEYPRTTGTVFWLRSGLGIRCGRALQHRSPSHGVGHRRIALAPARMRVAPSSAMKTLNLISRNTMARRQHQHRPESAERGCRGYEGPPCEFDGTGRRVTALTRLQRGPDEASSILEVQFLRRQGPASQRQSSSASWDVTSTTKRKQSDRQAATRVKRISPVTDSEQWPTVF